MPGTRLRMPVAWMRTQHIKATVLKVVGAPTLSSADGVKANLDAATTLNLGDTIVTDSTSTVSIQMGDGTQLIVLPGSVITMESLRQYVDTDMVDSIIKLDQGRVEVVAKPATGAGSRFQIKTPSAITAVRGTQFRVGEVDGISLNETLEGRIGVSAGGDTKSVTAGFGVVVKNGSRPSTPIELLPGPTLEFVKPMDRLDMILDWPKVEGASGYRAQVFKLNDNNHLLLDKTTGKNSVKLPAPEDGEYRLVVRAIDPNQLEGFNSQTVFEVDARPVPPPQIGPYRSSRILENEGRLYLDGLHAKQGVSFPVG